MPVLTSAEEVHAALHASLDEMVSAYLAAVPVGLTWEWTGEAEYDEKRLTLTVQVVIRPRPTAVE